MTHPPESRRLSDPALFPERLGRYDVLLPIASGGMATVYLARAVGLGGFERDVALKLTHFHLREDPDFVSSLIDEARLAGKIRHPNVVAVLDVGDDPHGVFIVMEYVEGESLASVQRLLRKASERMPIAVTLRVLDDLLLGLHAAHELVDEQGQPLNLVHRDVTPHNVLLGIDGVAKLADFGIAKATSRHGNTATGLIKGKIAYMAPEQAQGHSIDRRVDVWAAGVLAWESLTGSRLHDGPNDAAILLKIVREAPMRVRAVESSIPPAIDDVIAKALCLDVEERFASADAFAEALVHAAREAGIARAERREVTQFLTPLLEGRLGVRREKAREVHTLRQQVEQLVSRESPSQQSGPSAIRSVAEAAAPRDVSFDDPTLPLATVPTLTAPEARAATVTTAETVADARLVDVLPTEDLHLEPLAQPNDQTQTGTAGISTMARSIMPPRRPRLLLFGAALGAMLLLVALLFAAFGRDEPKPESTPASSPASTMPAAPAQAPTPTATAPVEAPEPQPVAVTPDAAVGSGEAAHQPPPKRRPPAPPSKPGVVSTPPKLLGNPYKP